MVVNKDKNIMTFEIAEGKVYRFDINSGELLGLRQKPISSFPPAIVKHFANLMMCNTSSSDNNLIDCLIEFSKTYPSRAVLELWKEYAQILDLLSTIGYNIHEKSGWGGFSRVNLDFVKSHYREFCAVFKENSSITLDGFRMNFAFSYWVKSHNLMFNDFFTEDVARWMFSHRYSRKWSDKEMEIAIYYLNRGLYQFLDYATLEKLNQYFHTCRELEKEPKKAKDFMREWVETAMSYQILKDAIDEKHLIKNQMRKKDALNFEDDNFTVIIPTTPKQFVDEGEAQNNCVARTYLPYVIQGDTYIVFIRRKENPDESYITCEVNSDGGIRQYLTRFNHHVDDAAANSFKVAYQKHLLENWGE